MPVVQAKLRVGASNDTYEQEADRVADRIMRMPGPIAPWLTEATESVQRLCSECASGSSLCPECAAEEEKTIHAKARPGQTAEASRDLGARLQAIKSGGQPLPPEQRSYFEARFGRIFLPPGSIPARPLPISRPRLMRGRSPFSGISSLARESIGTTMAGIPSTFWLMSSRTWSSSAARFDAAGGNSNAKPARTQSATNEPETVRRAPVSPAHPSTMRFFSDAWEEARSRLRITPRLPRMPRSLLCYGPEQCISEYDSSAIRRPNPEPGYATI